MGRKRTDDFESTFIAARRRLQTLGTTTVPAPATIGPHTHSADQITAEPEAVTALLSGDDVQEDLEELGVEKLARSGAQPMLGDLDHGGFDAKALKNIHVTGGIGEAILDGLRRLTMAGIGLIEAVLKLDFTGAGVGDGIIDKPRVIHMAGDDDDDEARIDGLERIVFNDEPTKSVVDNPSVVQLNPSVEAGVDTVHQEGQVGWDSMERTFVQDTEPSVYTPNGGPVAQTPRFSMGWAVVNCINDSGDPIPPFSVVYVSSGVADTAIRPGVAPWDGSAETFGAQLGTSQRVTGVTLHGSDDGEPLQVVRRGIVRGINLPKAGYEGWAVGDTLWADRSAPGEPTKFPEESGEYARIFIGTVIQATEVWTVDVDVRVLPTLGELSFVALGVGDLFVPMFDAAAGWVPKQVDHNAHLATLQGGAADEYYHLTEAAAGVAESILVVESNTGTKAPDPSESGETYTNEGDIDGSIINLPAAVAGLCFTVVCQAAQTITINAASGDTIRMGATVSAAGGLISTATIGNAVTLLAINATEWVAISYIGTVGTNWTVT
jgi:hypothetical protein